MAVALLMFVLLQCWQPIHCLQARTVYATVGSSVNFSVHLTYPACLKGTWLWKPQWNCSGKGTGFQLALTAQNFSGTPLDSSLCFLQRRLHILAGCRLHIDGVEFTDAGNFTFQQEKNESLVETVFQLITVKVGVEPPGPTLEGRTATLFCQVSLTLSAPSIVLGNSGNVSSTMSTNHSQTTTRLTVRNMRSGEVAWKCVIEDGKYTVDYQLTVIASHSSVGNMFIFRLSCLLFVFCLLLTGYVGYHKCKCSGRNVNPCIQLEAFVRRHSLLREEI
ncbi:uncharacterized protein LOC122556886 [Chiloscyllium plagiosum]|uniref:uncharacterized protein LOC122556886 n=1 Tax=Chiloscyllium plagiosum TaxID=36176 RepID=UPI001CB86444|nr:uncharacterized protein LOC122556886 [Chiloscyllium plagiosum]